MDTKIYFPKNSYVNDFDNYEDFGIENEDGEDVIILTRSAADYESDDKPFEEDFSGKGDKKARFPNGGKIDNVS